MVDGAVMGHEAVLSTCTWKSTAAGRDRKESVTRRGMAEERRGLERERGRTHS